MVAVAADEIAGALGNARSANMAALGAYLWCQQGVVDVEAVVAVLPEVLAQRHHDTLEANAEALRRGAAAARACVEQGAGG